MRESDDDAAVRAFWLAQAGPPLPDDGTPRYGWYRPDLVTHIWGVGIPGVRIEERGDGIYRVHGAYLLDDGGQSFQADTLEQAQAWVETIYRPERARIDAQIQQWIAEAKAAKRAAGKEQGAGE